MERRSELLKNTEGFIPPEERSTVNVEDCRGHFEAGPKIMPAFKMLERFMRHIQVQGETIGDNQIWLPQTVQISIGDMLPEGTEFTTIKQKGLDLINYQENYLLQRQPHKFIRISGTIEPYNKDKIYKPPSLLKAARSKNKQPTMMDTRTIKEIIPQGEEIRFIDSLVTPATENVLAQAIHLTTMDDYKEIQHRDGNSIFKMPTTLEGLGQLAYLYFYGSPNYDPQLIPYFKEIKANFHHYQAPTLGETITYQLTKIELDGKRKSIIEGRTITSEGKLIAQYSAKAGLIKTKALEAIVQKIRFNSKIST